MSFHHCWSPSAFASVNCPVLIIQAPLLGALVAFSWFTPQISNGRRAVCASDLVCWHVLFSPESVLKMFMVVANNKRVTLYIRSLNAAFDRGNELAALGGRPLVAVSLGPWAGRVCASGAECTPLIGSLPGLCTLALAASESSLPSQHLCRPPPQEPGRSLSAVLRNRRSVPFVPASRCLSSFLLCILITLLLLFSGL